MITDKTIFGVEDVVRLGVKHGVTVFNFLDMYDVPPVDSDFTVSNVNILPTDDLAKGLACLERAIDLANCAGCKVECQPELLRRTRDKVNGTALIPSELPKGMTRDCGTPWEYAFLAAKGEVFPCCGGAASVGDLRSDTLDTVLNGTKIKQLRRDLLHGNLEGTACMRCYLQPEISLKAFQRRMSGRVVRNSIRQRVISLFASR